MNQQLIFAFLAMVLSAPLLVAVPLLEHKYGTPKSVTTFAWFAGEFIVIAIAALATGQYKPTVAQSGNPGMWLALLGGGTIGAAALYCMIRAFGIDNNESAAVVMTIVNANPVVAVLALLLFSKLIQGFESGVSDKQTFGVFLALPVFYLLASTK